MIKETKRKGSLSKVVRGISKTGIILGAIYLSQLGINHLSNNKVQIIEKEGFIRGTHYSITKPDKGFFNNTNFQRYNQVYLLDHKDPEVNRRIWNSPNLIEDHRRGLLDHKTDEVVQSRLFGEVKKMIDGGVYGQRNGLVDRIEIKSTIPNIDKKLDRDEHYEAYKNEFDRADELLAKTKERFAKYLK